MVRSRIGRGLLAQLAVSTSLAALPAVAQVNAGTGDSQQSAPLPVGDPVGATADTAQDGDDIVVTGIRQSLEAARDLKRNAIQFVDAIVADDIGKLPDNNVAESLQRVSGVQIDRGIGEGTDVSIRGLRQNVVLYNGRQIYDATGRGGNGLDQLGTSTYGLLSLVPSEQIARLEVTKLAGADQIAGALGGIVDIQTRRPLDTRRTQVAASGGWSYDELPGKPGIELFGLASTVFGDGRWGALITASYTQRNLAQDGLDTFSGYARFTDTTVTPNRTRFGNSDVRAQEIDEERRKYGVNGVLQFQPTDAVTITADTFFSKLTSDRDRRWLSFTPTAGLRNAVYSANDILLAGQAVGPVLSNTEAATVKSNVWSSALHGDFALSERLKLTTEISYGRSTSTYKQIYFRLQPLATITPTIDFDFRQGDFGAYRISGIDLTDPAQLRFTILFDQFFRARTENLDGRGDLTFDIDGGFLKSLQVGGRYSDLDSQQNPTRADARPTGGIVASQLGGLVGVYANPDFLKDDFAGLPRSYLVGTPAVTGCAAFAAYPAVAQNAQCVNPNATINSIAGTFDVGERFLDGYAKVNIDTELGGGNLSGNVGVRYVDRRLASTGNIINAAGVATPTTFRRQDGEWLPSAVLKLSVADRRLVFRAGAARVVAFPNTEDLNNGVTLNNNAVFSGGVQISPGTGTGGAPGLDPFKANQYDGSVEYYFGQQALVSLGGFYKDISTFIVQRQSAESYNGTNFLINRNVNGQGAKVKGLEALVQLPFYFLPTPLDGFGAVVTYAYIDSETPIRDISGRALTLPGLSRNNVNLIGYYERGPVSLRVAYNWRDQFLIGLSPAATGIYNDSYRDLSTTLQLDFSKRVSLTLEANNLLNSRQRTYDGVSEALRTNVIFGRIYKAKLAVRF